MNDNVLLTVNHRLFFPFRIHIMKILYNEGETSFLDVRNRLNITNGNLVSHFRFLIDEDFVTFRKEIVSHRVSTVYSITKKGREEYQKFRKLMLEVLK